VREELCGLHTGVAITDQSVEDSGRLPTDIHLFRVGIVALAGGWGGRDAEERIGDEIRITLLHEIGHHFGLEEDDLADLGYD
jgi:predicted Zn-dependent protease with MMP-like domain